MISHHSEETTVADKVKMDEICAEVREMVARRVAEGFDPPEQIVDDVTECVEMDHEADELRPYVERVTAELLEEHRRRQGQWDGPTDCDRLDEAFAELDRGGVVARQNFTCCQT
jgi:hypothetical protein